jgi:hypothetical protein
VRQLLMKSRGTLYRKSGCTAYRLCRYFSIVSVDTSGRRFDLPPEKWTPGYAYCASACCAFISK